MSSETVMKRETVSPASAIINSATSVGAGAGFIGAAFAAGNATLKGRRVVLWSAVAGGQCCALGFTYWLSRQILSGSVGFQRQTESRSIQDELMYSTISGSIAGLVGGSLRGRSNIIPGALVFGMVGLGGQLGVSSLAAAIDAPKERKPILERLSTSKWWPLQSVSDTDYENQLKEQLEALNTEINMVDSQISALKERRNK